MKTPIKKIAIKIGCWLFVLLGTLMLTACLSKKDTYDRTENKIGVTPIVSTFAGSGYGYSNDGQGTSASFNIPWSVAVDSQGNIYVADTNNHNIRKINADGKVITLAGTGTAGSNDGQGTNASFRYPAGVAVDSLGNVYVADTNNHKIRKISADGKVSTLAGGGVAGASFTLPYGVAVDNLGNVYVADTNNHKIRKINANGEVTTLAGSGNEGSADGQGSEASFNIPYGIAVDSLGNVYVAEPDNHKIRKIDANGKVTTLAGNGKEGSADGQRATASFKFPQNVAVDSQGNVYVADTDNHKIRKIDANGKVTTLAGNGKEGSADGQGSNATFKSPKGIAADSLGNIYVGDTYNHKIRKITPLDIGTAR